MNRPRVVARERRSIAHLVSKLRVAHRANWGLQLAIVIVVPGGLVALALLWWLDRHQALRRAPISWTTLASQRYRGE